MINQSKANGMPIDRMRISYKPNCSGERMLNINVEIYSNKILKNVDRKI